MEHTNNTTETPQCGCKNNYNEETFLESFGVNDTDVKNCNNCPYMEFDCGMMCCKKFS